MDVQVDRIESFRRPHSPSSAAHPLAGRRILIVEDEALVALDLEMTLRAAGAATVGPCLRLPRALTAAETEEVDAVLLDIRLGRQESYPVADALHARGVAIVFHSGHADIGHLRARYPGAGTCPKPCTPATVVRTLAQAIADRSRSAAERLRR